MRVIRFLLSGLVVLAILGGVGFLITREVLLFMGMSEVRQSVTGLRQIATNAGPYYQECRNKGAADSPDVLGSIQLRFTSEKEYVMEVVCSQFQLDPIVVSMKELPIFVTKKPGQAGIIWGDALSGVTLEVWGRSSALIVENREARTGSEVELDASLGPLTSCQGYGFQCCPTDTSIGEGSQYTAVSDCPRTCFSSCQQRPAVLSLITQPFFDTKTRTLQISAGETVEFLHVVQMGSVKTGSLSLDFGDGQRTDLEIPKGSTSHQYECAQARCLYQAKLNLVDANGIEAVQGDIGSIQIEVIGSSL